MVGKKLRSYLLVILGVAAGCGANAGDEWVEVEHRSEAHTQASAASGYRPLFGTVTFLPEGRPPFETRVELAREWVQDPSRTEAYFDGETPAETTRGLMFRRSMPENEGMLFLFRRSGHRSFWMMNTFIPLDMIFVRSDMTVLGVASNAEPQTTDPREVEGTSQFVVEVNAGFAARHGIVAGTRVRFDDVPTVPRVIGGAQQEEDFGDDE